MSDSAPSEPRGEGEVVEILTGHSAPRRGVAPRRSHHPLNRRPHPVTQSSVLPLDVRRPPVAFGGKAGGVGRKLGFRPKILKGVLWHRPVGHGVGMAMGRTLRPTFAYRTAAHRREQGWSDDLAVAVTNRVWPASRSLPGRPGARYYYFLLTVWTCRCLVER